MIKVASVIHYPTFGGPHNRNLRLAPLLAERGYHLEVVLPDEAGSGVDRLRDEGVPTHVLPLSRFRISAGVGTHAALAIRYAQQVRSLAEYFCSSGIDVVQINGLVNPHAAAAARRANIPLVWQLLDTRSPRSLRRVAMSYVVRRASVIMTDGVTVATLHPPAASFKNLVHFYPPVDTSRFRPSSVGRADARRRLGLSPRSLVIGTVGNLNPQKGHELLLEAVGLIANRGLTAECLIMGATTSTHLDYAARLKAQASHITQTQGARVKFVDPGPHVADLLPAIDVFVRSSVPLSEGTSTAVLEALACGLPVVSTDVGGLRDVVDADVGALVPPRDAIALADQIADLLQDPERRKRCGAAARERATSRYDTEYCLLAHVKAYELALRR